MLATSEPVFDSVIAKKPSCVPATQPPMYFSFCSGVPNFATVSAGPRFCMLNGRRHDAETLAICSAIKHGLHEAHAAAAVLLGSAQEKKPSEPIFATRRRGTRASVPPARGSARSPRRRSAGRVLDQLLFGGQFEVHGGSSGGCGNGAVSR